MDKNSLLKKDSDFQKVYRAKKISSSKDITLFTKKNSLKLKHFGITTTKKVGNAVKRNFLKRRMKALLRENFNHIKDGYDYVFVLKKEANSSTYDDLKKSFFYVLKRQDKVIKWEKFVCFWLVFTRNSFLDIY